MTMNYKILSNKSRKYAFRKKI